MMQLRTTSLALALLIPVLFAAPAPADESIATAIASELANAPAEVLGTDGKTLDLSAAEVELYAIYHGRAMQPIWLLEGEPNEHALALKNAIAEAGTHGLRPADFGLVTLESHWPANDANTRAQLDLQLTESLLAWVNTARHGRGGIRDEPVSLVNTYLASEKPADYLAALHPAHRYYLGLQANLHAYRKLAETAGKAPIPGNRVLHPGDRDPMVVALRERLIAEQEAGKTEATVDLFDAPLVEKVRHFQLMHGLTPDGVVGAATLAALNVPLAYRLRQIEMNMERWRRMDHDLGQRYVMVDIASFDVQGVVDDRTEVEMRAIVGKRHHETPVFSDRIRYIEFIPYWNLTPSIARHETIPKIRKNPGYLAEKHIRVFDGWGRNAAELDPMEIDWTNLSNPARLKFRQDPGPWNALGTMKFIFPNKHSVYLHDTPNHALFEKAERDFSHGCIRLSEPAQLAAWLLSLHPDDADWDSQKIQAVLDSQQRTVKNLSTPIPVHLTYETAWIDGEGRLRFAPDVYGRDDALELALYGDNLAR